MTDIAAQPLPGSTFRLFVSHLGAGGFAERPAPPTAPAVEGRPGAADVRLRCEVFIDALATIPLF
jgi:hypothetical protein